jgi:ATP-dependent DNA ligase
VCGNQESKSDVRRAYATAGSNTLPDDDGWKRDIKLDGYRGIAFRRAGRLYLRSRNDNEMAARYPVIAEALGMLPDDTVVDGELVALDEQDRPSFNLLQSYGNSSGPLLFFIFDLLVISGKDLKRNLSKPGETCWRRRSCQSWRTRSGFHRHSKAA